MRSNNGVDLLVGQNRRNGSGQPQRSNSEKGEDDKKPPSLLCVSARWSVALRYISVAYVNKAHNKIIIARCLSDEA